MSLYHKYRPKTLDEVYGNEDVVLSLTTMLEDIQNFPHAILFHGQTGCGKTTLGRIIASELGCKGNDFREVDSADFRGIDTIREVRKQSQFKPLESICRIWLIDECHKLTNDAQNALLKILEDTPVHVYFILCTTDPQNMLATIKGRCSQFQVKPLSERQMSRLLRRTAKSEEVELAEEVINQIVQDSFCFPRNALQILDKVLRVDSEKQLDIAKQYAEQQSKTIELCRALLGKPNWKEIKEILTGLKDQPAEDIRRTVLGYCQSVLLKSDNERAGIVMEQFIEPFYNVGFPGLTFACYSIYKS